MVHAWVYAATLILVAAAAGGGVAYYYGFGQTPQQFTVPLTVSIDGVARGGTTPIPGITVTITYSTPSGQVTDSSVTNTFGTATFNVPTNAHVTISDILTGAKTVDVGTSAQSVTLYHVYYSS